MPDWNRFHAAVVAGSQPYELCRACELAWSCLDLPEAEWRDRIRANVRSDADGTRLQNALVLVRMRLLRDHGIDPADQARFAQVNTAIAEGRASAAELKLRDRWASTIAFGHYALELFPGGVPNRADPDLEALNARIPALRTAIEATGAGAPSPATLDALQDAIRVFADDAKGWSGRAATDRDWWLGLAWWAFGDALARLGRRREARDAMLRAAPLYEAGGAAKDAASCRDRAVDIETRHAADFDGEADREVRRMLDAQTPLERVKSLTRLVRAIGKTGDLFAANQAADEAAQLLEQLGYSDPEHAFDAAVHTWIVTAVKGCEQNALVARVYEVTEFWATILGARTSARLENDAAGSARAERSLRGLALLTGEIQRQAAHANNDLALRLAVWMPDAPTMLADRPAAAAAQGVDALAALDDELHRLRVACNEGASEAQVAQAAELQARAESLGSRVHVASAMLEQAYVLLALKRFRDVPAVADRAVATLVAGQPATLSAFSTGFERELYLWAIDYKARALSALGDHAATLALLEPVIRDIEGERSRVSSPYQQSAFLATRAQLYELAAAAAYRTDRIDEVLAIGELLKARAALQSRLTPAFEPGDDGIEAQFRTINDALARSVPGTPEERRLREERQWLLTARSIARARQRSTRLPQIGVAAVQQALAEDECAISWVWVGSSALIVLAISRDGVRHTIISLTPAHEAQLNDYVACLTALGEASPIHETLVPRIGELIAELGVVLLPAPVRAFIARKSRLVLSPHRALHLFPFHAAPWPGGHVIDRFSVRYVPSLTSLLVPWEGKVDGPVLAVGVAKFDDPAVPELPQAEREACAVAAAHGTDGHAVTGATRAQFLSAPLADYRCLHLATHGGSVLAGDALDDPMQTCLYLRDGALNGFEIAALPLRAELAVLGACHSGQRSIAGRGLARLPGDDIFGLQGVLFDAGVGAVLGALWVVHDEIARAILTDFHRGYAAGAAPEIALQAAVEAHRRDPQRPQQVFYWAPFFLSALGAPRPGNHVDTARKMSRE